MSLNNNVRDTIYHCYDCGCIWNVDEIDIIQNKDSIKYVCKECRGRCIPKSELKKVKGIKSIKQRYRNRRIGLYIIIGIILLFSYFFYERRVTIGDYKNYLAETAILRKSINYNLKTFREDYKLIEEYKKTNKKDDNKIIITKKRFFKSKKYIFSKINEVEQLEKPQKKEIIELYQAEVSFWKDPSYINYIKYMGEFNDLKRKYGNDFFELIKDKVRSKLEKNNRKNK